MDQNNIPLLTWNIYEVRSAQESLHGVMLRGRIRKLGLEKGFNVLCENASDEDNCVRFAVLSPDSATLVIGYLKSIIPDVTVTNVAAEVTNPVLSKLKVNKEDRYTL
jgi:hypothetical protein